MNKQKDPSFKPHYWSLSIQTESAILRKCTRKIRNVGNSSMSTTIRCWLSVDLIKMGFFFSCLYLQRSCRMYCVAFHLLRLFWWQLKDLCVQIFTSLYAECWQKSFSFASGLYFIQWRGFIGKKKNVCSVLHHAPGSLSMIKHQAGLRSLQVDTATRDTQKKNAFVHLVRSDKNNMSHTNRLITSRSMLAEQKLNYEASKAV